MHLLNVNQIKKIYTISKMFQKTKYLNALNGVSFLLNQSETLGIVGESGCGKSTLAKVLTRLEKITSGTVQIDGKDITTINPNEFHSLIQMVFQDPYQSLNPRKKAFDIIADPLYIKGGLTKKEIEHKVINTMEKVGLHRKMKERYPHQFSGGERQRLGIARSLMLNPKILVLDEPVSALDVSIQAQVLNLLLDLQKERNLSYLFISHDLSVVAHMSDKIIVMYLGKIVEYGTRDQVFNSPKHPYTKMLLESEPDIYKKKKREIEVIGELPSPFNLPKGCSFSSRCPFKTSECTEKDVDLQNIYNRYVACIQVHKS